MSKTSAATGRLTCATVVSAITRDAAGVIWPRAMSATMQSATHQAAIARARYEACNLQFSEVERERCRWQPKLLDDMTGRQVGRPSPHQQAVDIEAQLLGERTKGDKCSIPLHQSGNTEIRCLHQPQRPAASAAG